MLTFLAEELADVICAEALLAWLWKGEGGRASKGRTHEMTSPTQGPCLRLRPAH